MEYTASRKRQPAFSPDEIDFLKEIVKSHKKVVDSRDNSNESIARKTAAWQAITNEFNSIPQFTKRTEKNLKKCWDNLKTQQKRAISAKKRESMKTGGGSKEKDLSDEPDVGDCEEGQRFALAPSISGGTNFILEDGVLREIKREEIVVEESDPALAENHVERISPQNEIESYGNGESSSTTQKTCHGKQFDEHDLRCKKIKLQIEQDVKISSVHLEEAKLKKQAAAVLLEEAELKKQTAAIAVEAEKKKLLILQLEYERTLIELDKAKKNNFECLNN